MRQFPSGASRNGSEGKLDYDRFLSPIVLQRYAEYMQKHRHLENGELRPPDNWKKGIPLEAYMSSLMRHVHDLWMEHEGYPSREGIEDALCGILFNASGYLHEVLKKKYEHSTESAGR